MKRIILILLFLPMCMGVAFAQVDTVSTHSKGVGFGRIEKLGAPWDVLRLELNMGGTSVKHVAHRMKDLEYVRFADGFRLDYLDGAPLRDNLLSCPTWEAKGNQIWAEGQILLKRTELQSLFGDRLYTLGYQPADFQFKVGGWQFGLGVAEFLLLGIHMLNINKIESIYYNSYKDMPSWILPVNYFSMGMMLSGLMSINYVTNTIDEILQIRDAAPLMSLETAKKEFWWGLAGTGAGLATMVAGACYWQNNYVRAADAFPTASIVMMVGGSLLANVGLFYTVRGGAHLRAHSRYNSQLSLGGTGLTYCF